MNPTPVYKLDANKAWTLLTDYEKNYAYLLHKASWHGARINMRQCSPESPIIFDMLQSIFITAERPETLVTLCQTAGLSDTDIELFLDYATKFYGNLGNYSSFGDTKFVPELDRSVFQQIIEISGSSDAMRLFDYVQDIMFSRDPNSLDFGNTGYLSSNVTREDAKIVQDFLDANKISAYNTRLLKEGPQNYIIKVASILKKVEQRVFKTNNKVYNITMEYGDHTHELDAMFNELINASAWVTDLNKGNMLTNIARSYYSGNIEDHKKGQIWWVKDKNPVVETIHGFIESYKDPFKVRGTYEGIVAIVNKEKSIKYQKLVENAEFLVAKLPWGAEFEKDKFMKPDFNNIDVLTFVSNGVPAGINLPNYHDIREQYGFKNVYLGNVVGAVMEKRSWSEDYISFSVGKDTISGEGIEIMVALHELLGHGSLKLITDPENIIDPLTGKPLTTWYKPEQTWRSVFTDISAAYEECRAESVAMLLCLEPLVMEIFGHHDAQKQKILVLANWLGMIVAAIRGLEHYSPETGKWRQAHCRARFAIWRVLDEWTPGLIEINVESRSEAGDEKLVVNINPELIYTNGKKAMRTFLLHLGVYKASANVEEGRAFFEKYTKVTQKYLDIREIVISNKTPRNVWVQANINKTLLLKEYPETQYGLIQSFIDRAELLKN